MSSPRFNFLQLVGRNLKRRPLRTFTTILLFAVIAATLFSFQYLITGAEQGLDQGTTWMGSDLIVMPEHHTAEGESSLITGRPSMFFFNDSGYEKIARIPGVARTSPRILVATLSDQSRCSGLVQIIAVDPARDLTLAPWLAAHPGVTMGKDDIIVGSRIDGEVGSLLKFYGHSFRIAGELEPTGMMGVDMVVLTRIDDTRVMAEESGEKAAQAIVIPGGMVSAILVQVDPGVSPADVGSEIRKSIPGTRTITRTGLLATVTLHLASVTRVLSGLHAHDRTPLYPAPRLHLGHGCAPVRRRLRSSEHSALRELSFSSLILPESFTSSVIGSFLGIGSAAVILVGFQDFITYSLEIPFTIPRPSPFFSRLAVRSCSRLPSVAWLCCIRPSKSYGRRCTPISGARFWFEQDSGLRNDTGDITYRRFPEVRDWIR